VLQNKCPYAMDISAIIRSLDIIAFIYTKFSWTF